MAGHEFKFKVKNSDVEDVMKEKAKEFFSDKANVVSREWDLQKNYVPTRIAKQGNSFQPAYLLN